MLVKAGPMRARVLEHWADWETYLLGASAEELPAQMHLHEATGRPMGSRAFIEKLQSLLGRALLPQKRGRRPKASGNSNGIKYGVPNGTKISLFSLKGRQPTARGNAPGYVLAAPPGAKREAVPAGA